MQIGPIVIDIRQADFDDFSYRLAHTRWAHHFANEDWLYSVELGWLQEMTTS